MIADEFERLYQSTIFYVFSDVRTTKARLIFNMKELNISVVKESFTMIKISDIIQLIGKDNFACTLDISKAYHHISINEKFQKCFFLYSRQCKIQIYLYMPFGLTTAPYIFSKTTDAIWKFLRKKYFMTIFAYLDDILILGDSFEKTRYHSILTVNLLNELGFKMNLENPI